MDNDFWIPCDKDNKSPFYIENQVWLCPICETETQITGDLESKSRIVVGEKMCDDCKQDIRELISIYTNRYKA